MALQQVFTTIHGVVLNESYIRIDDQSGKDTAVIRVRYYANKGKCHEGFPWLQEELFTFGTSLADDAPNFIRQGYEYLKTLPEFSSAVDV